MASELWAARNSDQTLHLFDVAPFHGCNCGSETNPVVWSAGGYDHGLLVDGGLLPDLQPGQCVRVKIVPVTEGEADA